MHNVKSELYKHIIFRGRFSISPLQPNKTKYGKILQEAGFASTWASSSHSEDVMNFFVKTLRARAESNDIESSFQIDVISFRQISTRSSLHPQFKCMVFSCI